MGTLDALIGSAFGSIFGSGAVMGVAITIFFVYVAFKCGIPMSGLVFIANLLVGALVLLAYIDPLFFGLVLVIDAYLFWRAAMQVAG